MTTGVQDGGADLAASAPSQPPAKNALWFADFDTDPGAAFRKDAYWTICQQPGESKALCVSGGDRSTFFTNGATWTDYVAEVSAIVSTGGASLFVRAKDPMNHYSLELKFDGTNKLFLVWKMVDGKQSVLKSGKVDFPFKTYFRLRVQVKGAELSYAMKADAKAVAWTELGKVTDAAHTMGGVGLKTHATSGRFDDLLVVPPQ